METNTTVVVTRMSAHTLFRRVIRNSHRGAWRALVAAAWLVAAACGTTGQPEAEIPVPLPVEQPAAKRAPVKPLPRTKNDAVGIEGADGLVALCESLRDEASMTFAGNPVEQARAFEAHAQGRQAAMASSFVVIVPPQGFAFRNYDLGERRLVLDTDRSFVLGDGAELFAPNKDPSPGFVLTTEMADRILAERSAGKVSLRILFRPGRSELRKDGCLWLGGGRIVKLEIDIVGTALLGADGAVLSRGDTGEYADSSMVAPVRSPRVSLRKPRTAEGREVPAAITDSLAALASKSQPCYERALTVRPSLRGTLVLAARLGPGGRIEAPYVEMSSLGDDAVVKCVLATAGKLSVQGGAVGQRLSIPLHFSSADEP